MAPVPPSPWRSLCCLPAPWPPGWIRGPLPEPCLLPHSSRSPPETLTLASLCRHGRRRPSSPRRRLKPPRGRPSPPPAPHRRAASPRARNQAGAPGVAASVRFFTAAGRARRGPFRRRRPSSAVSDHGNVLVVSSCGSPCPPPSPTPSGSPPRHSPSRSAATMAAGEPPVTKWSHSAAPRAPLCSL